MPADGTFHRYESQVRSYCRSYPAVFTKARGPYLWDLTGRRYVDLLCGAGSLNYGHNDPRITAAVRWYLDQGGPVQSLDLYTAAKAAFIDRFVETVLLPRSMDYVLQFPGPAGTLAVEAALKLARKVTGRTNVVAFTGGFHGASLGSLSLSSSPLLRQASGVPLGPVAMMPYDGFLGDVDTATVLGRMLSPGSGIDPPAAIVVETVQGEGGLTAASARWLRAVQRVARDVGAVFVVDDIQAGCGRTGRFFSFDGMGVEPDLICLSKSLSGIGLPLAMVLIRRDLDRWRPGEHNGTFRGNNLAFVAGAAALDYWTDETFLSQVDELASAVGEDLAALVAELGRDTVTVAGRGLMSGLRFVREADAARIKRELFDNGIIAETSGAGHVLKLLPPLTMGVAEWRATFGELAEVAIGSLDDNDERQMLAA
jgi:diaminobutyrate-2-oxoglutarate transaminase